MTSDVTPRISRRRFIAGGALLASSILVGSAGRGDAAGASIVVPTWSEAIRRNYGIVAHPDLTRSVYSRVDAWTLRASQLGAYYIRGMYDPRLPATKRTVERCRALGLKWHMLLAPENWGLTLEELRIRLAHIRDHAADVCIAVEGISEPNTHGDGGDFRPDWPAATAEYQHTISNFVRATPRLSHIEVVGPSLRLTTGDPAADYMALARTGIGRYQTRAGTHSYSGGFPPQHQLDQRLGWVSESFGSIKTVITETGYRDERGSNGGHRAVPADVAATYAPRALLEAVTRGCPSTRSGLLDLRGSGEHEPQSSFGLIECPDLDPATWRNKPEFWAMRKLLASLRDASAEYSPPPVQFAISGPSTLRHVLIGKSDGGCRVLMYLDTSVWDPVRKARVTSSGATITVTDRLGPRRVRVGPRLRSFVLR